MVAKISVGNSLYGAIAYNGEKINEAQGRLLTTNRIYNDGSGKVDINKAMEGFLTFMPPQMKVEKPVVHISLNPHPEDALTDAELQDIAREYLEKLGFGNQPYLVFKHEDIDRHHLHIVTVRVDENGKCISDKNNYYRSKQITRELEKKYGLHDAERRNRRLDTPLSKVDASAGDVKKQVGNTVKALNGQYRFQTMGEYRALLSIYNLTVEEARGNVRGREYHGLVYSVTDGRGNMVRVSRANANGGLIHDRRAFDLNNRLLRQQVDGMAPLLYDYDPFGNIVKTTLKLAENPTPANSLVTEYAYARRQREDGVYRVTTVTRCNSQGTTYAERTAERCAQARRAGGRAIHEATLAGAARHGTDLATG